jgi:hypothetical protein
MADVSVVRVSRYCLPPEITKPESVLQRTIQEWSYIRHARAVHWSHTGTVGSASDGGACGSMGNIAARCLMEYFTPYQSTPPFLSRYVVIRTLRIIIICITGYLLTLSLTAMTQVLNAGILHALILDSFFQNFLFGVIVAQAFQYWYDCKDDPRPRRIFVATVVFFSA